jgi:hypothetical protein
LEGEAFSFVGEGQDEGETLLYKCGRGLDLKLDITVQLAIEFPNVILGNFSPPWGRIGPCRGFGEVSGRVREKLGQSSRKTQVASLHIASTPLEQLAPKSDVS